MFPKIQNPKRFDHYLVKPLSLTRHDTDNGRFYSLSGDDHKRCPSVTTVLSHLGNNDWYDEWIARVGTEAAATISARAAYKGTNIHKLCETYLLNQDINSEMKKCHFVISSRFRNLEPYLRNIQKVIAVELQMISFEWNMAGTTDLIAEIDNRIEVIDFKTSSRIKKEEDITGYFVQLCAYSKLFQECYNFKITHGRIIMSVEGMKDPLIFVTELSKWEPLLKEAIANYEKATKGN